jgi:hypothetical protein
MVKGAPRLIRKAARKAMKKGRCYSSADIAKLIVGKRKAIDATLRDLADPAEYIHDSLVAGASSEFQMWVIDEAGKGAEVLWSLRGLAKWPGYHRAAILLVHHIGSGSRSEAVDARLVGMNLIKNAQRMGATVVLVCDDDESFEGGGPPGSAAGTLGTLRREAARAKVSLHIMKGGWADVKQALARFGRCLALYYQYENHGRVEGLLGLDGVPERYDSAAAWVLTFPAELKIVGVEACHSGLLCLELGRSVSRQLGRVHVVALAVSQGASFQASGGNGGMFTRRVQMCLEKALSVSDWECRLYKAQHGFTARFWGRGVGVDEDEEVDSVAFEGMGLFPWGNVSHPCRGGLDHGLMHEDERGLEGWSEASGLEAALDAAPCLTTRVKERLHDCAKSVKGAEEVSLKVPEDTSALVDDPEWTKWRRILEPVEAALGWPTAHYCELIAVAAHSGGGGEEVRKAIEDSRWCGLLDERV